MAAAPPARQPKPAPLNHEPEGVRRAAVLRAGRWPLHAEQEIRRIDIGDRQIRDGGYAAHIRKIQQIDPVRDVDHDGGGSSIGLWQAQAKNRAGIGRYGERDVPAMGAHHVARDNQAEPGAALAR